MVIADIENIMPNNELFINKALIYRDSIRKIRSLLIRKKIGSSSISDYPSLSKPLEYKENEEWHNALYMEYENRLEQIIKEANLALKYLREAEETRKHHNDRAKMPRYSAVSLSDWLTGFLIRILNE